MENDDLTDDLIELWAKLDTNMILALLKSLINEIIEREKQELIKKYSDLDLDVLYKRGGD